MMVVSPMRKVHPRFRIPQGPTPAGASVLEAILRLRKRPTLYTADTVRGWLLDLPVEPGLLWKELGLEPRYRTIDDFRESRCRRGVPLAPSRGGPDA